MKIQFGGAVAKLVDYADDIVFVEMPALMKSEERIGRAQAALGHHPARPARQGAENDRLDELARDIVAPKPQRRDYTLAREADTRNFVLDGEIDQDGGEQWMNVKIQMSVDVIQIAYEIQMVLDLGAKFVGHFRAHRAVEEVTHPGENGILEEAAGGIDGARKMRRAEEAATAAYDGVQANVERGILSRQFGRGFGCGFGDHETRAAQYSVAMGTDNAGVDFWRESEVVGIDDYTLQPIFLPLKNT